jgi:transcriptional repressor NrdR
LEQRLPQVVKKDGTRQPFDREKLRFGFALACRKRPVSTEDLELAAENVVQKVVAESDREVHTTRLGELVLEALLELDRVAYLRFASVYQELATPEEFLEILNPLIGDQK